MTWSLVTPLARPPRAANMETSLGSGEVSCSRHREVLASLVRSVDTARSAEVEPPRTWLKVR